MSASYDKDKGVRAVKGSRKAARMARKAVDDEKGVNGGFGSQRQPSCHWAVASSES